MTKYLPKLNPTAITNLNEHFVSAGIGAIEEEISKVLKDDTTGDFFVTIPTNELSFMTVSWDTDAFMKAFDAVTFKFNVEWDLVKKESLKVEPNKWILIDELHNYDIGGLYGNDVLFRGRMIGYGADDKFTSETTRYKLGYFVDEDKVILSDSPCESYTVKGIQKLGFYELMFIGL